MSEKTAAVILLTGLIITMGTVGAMEFEKIGLITGAAIIIGFPAIMLITITYCRNHQ